MGPYPWQLAERESGLLPSHTAMTGTSCCPPPVAFVGPVSFEANRCCSHHSSLCSSSDTSLSCLHSRFYAVTARSRVTRPRRPLSIRGPGRAGRQIRLCFGRVLCRSMPGSATGGFPPSKALGLEVRMSSGLPFRPCQVLGIEPSDPAAPSDVAVLRVLQAVE